MARVVSYIKGDKIQGTAYFTQVGNAKRPSSRSRPRLRPQLSTFAFRDFRLYEAFGNGIIGRVLMESASTCLETCRMAFESSVNVTEGANS